MSISLALSELVETDEETVVDELTELLLSVDVPLLVPGEIGWQDAGCSKQEDWGEHSWGGGLGKFNILLVLLAFDFGLVVTVSVVLLDVELLSVMK